MIRHIPAGDGPLSPELALRVHDVCVRFEEELKARRKPAVEEFLPRVDPPGRAELFRELLGLELDYRRQWGELPTRQEYLERFPEYAGDVEDAVNPSDGEMPESIGRYRLVERLGDGGQAEVFRAFDPMLRQDVVVKWAKMSGDEECCRRVLDEARILAQLDEDPVLVRVYDAGVHLGRPYIVMQWVPGRALSALLDGGERFSVPKAVALVATLADALERLHGLGVLHLDLKPANVLIDTAGKPRLLDFGLAYLTQRYREIGRPEEGVAQGTLAYMAPEQARGQAELVGPRTDVFGLGAVLYHLVTNRRLYQAGDRATLLLQAQKGEVTPPRQINPRVTPALERVCMLALAADPAARPATAGDFAKELRLASPRPRSHPRRWLWVCAAVALVGFGLLLRGALWPTGPAEVVDLEVQGYRVANGQAHNLGLLGDAVHGFDALRFDDRVRVDVRLRHPAYCYLIALNADGTDQLCYPYPGDQAAPPRRVAQVSYPREPDVSFRLNDGVGLQAFVVIASRRPLPAYAEWKARVGGLPWKPGALGSAWRFAGQRIEPLVTGRVRAQENRLPLPEAFAELVRFLREETGAEAYAAVAFPVDVPGK
jgi:hypothetical protein